MGLGRGGGLAQRGTLSETGRPDVIAVAVNAERVAQRLKKANEYAQFIVVSLRKPMIQAAERTIGVAMQEGNISSITGVKLN
jgi:chromosome segregation protein